MSTILSAPALPEIFLVSFIFLGLSFFVLKQTKKNIHVGEWIALLIVAIILMFASLLYSFEKTSPIAGNFYHHGWPHTLYVTGQEAGGAIREGFAFGPFGSYFIVNILFYFAFLLLVLSIVKLIRTKK